MTIQEAYKRFLLKINKNDTNTEVSISSAEFVIIFNEQSLVWLKEKIKQKASTDSINDLDQLLVSELELSNFQETKNHVDFDLPEDYFEFVTARAIAEKDNCEKELDIINIKPKEKNQWLRDDLNNPSFEWEETISIITNNKIEVYKEDFDINGILLSYYKKPNKIDIEGYIHIDKTPSKTIHPDLSDQNVNEIINRCASAVAMDYQNGESFQLQEQRILKEK